MDNENVPYIYIQRMPHNYKKEGNLATATTWDPGGYYAEWNKSDWDRQILWEILFLCRIKQNKKQTHRYTEQTGGYRS